MGKNALVVDDDRLVLTVISEMLQNLGLATHCVQGGSDAITHLRSGAVIDVVVTDVVMPDVSGWEVFQTARQRSPSMPIIFVTGFIPKTLWTNVSGDPRAVVLDKPFTFEKLESALKTVMAE